MMKVNCNSNSATKKLPSHSKTVMESQPKDPKIDSKNKSYHKSSIKKLVLDP